ncbi:hypothetical protein DFH08DRAFT_997693 [Mycena albidolilacea]|uniref:Uncharacterized protein n=1 Tax=Mycena albidolilacea TaxID=1033008 RepID=A0AAD7E6E5_9AGAR|nr:hypothetical protein DFH08DRAFT_997691 [Mycena albidolilacea]KAJ7300793.1 hypothetical protein DFH08DRAFT_997693 [Mycena albidolilacea]
MPIPPQVSNAQMRGASLVPQQRNIYNTYPTEYGFYQAPPTRDTFTDYPFSGSLTRSPITTTATATFSVTPSSLSYRGPGSASMLGDSHSDYSGSQSQSGSGSGSEGTYSSYRCLQHTGTATGTMLSRAREVRRCPGLWLMSSGYSRSISTSDLGVEDKGNSSAGPSDGGNGAGGSGTGTGTGSGATPATYSTNQTGSYSGTTPSYSSTSSSSRWQPYNALASASTSSILARSPSISYLSTPATSVSSLSPPQATPLCETEQIKTCPSMPQTPRYPLNSLRENSKNKYATGLVVSPDQAAKSLCKIWCPQDIPIVFSTSSRVTVGSEQQAPLPPNSRRRNTQWPSPHSLQAPGFVPSTKPLMSRIFRRLGPSVAERVRAAHDGANSLLVFIPSTKPVISRCFWSPAAERVRAVHVSPDVPPDWAPTQKHLYLVLDPITSNKILSSSLGHPRESVLKTMARRFGIPAAAHAHADIVGADSPPDRVRHKT